jgi:hypothetical protein
MPTLKLRPTPLQERAFLACTLRDTKSVIGKLSS